VRKSAKKHNKSIEKVTLVSMYCYSMHGAMHFHTKWDVLIFEQLSGMCRQLLNGTIVYGSLASACMGIFFNSAGMLSTVYGEGVITDCTGCSKHYVGLFEQFIRCTTVL